MHAGDHSGAADVAQVRAGNGHADGHDGRIVIKQLADALVDGRDGVADGVVVHRGQVFGAERIAAQVEHADLHEGTGELDTNDAEASGVNFQPDGTAVLGAFQVAGLFNHAGFDKPCGDLGDGGRREFQGLGDLCAGADAVVVEMLDDAGAVGFGNAGLRSGACSIVCHIILLCPASLPG